MGTGRAGCGDCVGWSLERNDLMRAVYLKEERRVYLETEFHGDMSGC